MLVALFIVLQPDDEGAPSGTTPPTDEVESDGNRDPVAMESAPTANESDAASTELEKAGERDEVRTGHRILVLDVDGSPAAGVRVGSRIIQEDSLERELKFWYERPDSVWFLGSQPNELPTTSERGILQLDTLETCVVYAAEFGRVGKVWIEVPESGAVDEVHTMQLQAAPMREIHVLEATGEPTELRYRLGVRIAHAEAAAQLPADSSGRELNRAWIWASRRIGTIADGREMFVPQVGAGEHVRLGVSEGPFLFRMQLTGRGNGIAPQTLEFGAEETGPIEFHLPIFGEVALRVENAPGGLIPTLVPVGEGKLSDRYVIPTVQEDGLFFFPRVATQVEFEISAIIRATERSSGSPTHLELGSLVGPSVAGERIEKTIRYLHPPGFFGRFIFPEGVDPAAEFGDINRGLGRAKFILDQKQNRSPGAPIEMFPDGTFSASSGDLDPSLFPVENISNLLFVYRAEPKRDNEDPSAEDSPVFWAEVPARLPSLQASVDLGEITLQRARPLLEVVVRDAEGDPLQGAEVQVARKTRWDLEDSDPSAYSRSRSGQYFTDREGRLVCYHRDWFAEFGLEWSLSRADDEARIDVLQVEVSHPAASTQRIVIPASQTRVEFDLAGAGFIAGSVLSPPGIRFVTVTVALPGEIPKSSEVDSVHVDFRRKPTPPKQAFEIKSVPAGIWDVVFQVDGGTRTETLRVPSVQVVTGETTRDPRLQSIALTEHFEMIQLAFVAQNGRRFSDADRAEFAPQILRTFEGGSGSGGRPVWLEDEAVLPVKKGETLNLQVKAPGWIVQGIGAVGAGLHQVKVQRAPRVKLVLTGWSDLPAGVQLRLQIDSVDDRIGSDDDLLVDGPEVDFVVPAFDELVIHWIVVKSGSSTRYIQTKIHVPAQGTVDGTRITVEIPDEVFEAFND
jgi:hypothetical protein